MTDLATRKRYWARSLVGWRRISRAAPNDAHRALARLERAGRVELLVTQNVDRLHQAAGSEAVVDLHGRADVVRCMSCERRVPRADYQAELVRPESTWAELGARAAPDGDADLAGTDYASFRRARLRRVRRDAETRRRVLRRERAEGARERAMQALADADAVFVSARR